MASKYATTSASVRPRRMGGGFGRGPMIGEKPKNFKKAMSELLRYCKRFIAPTIVAVLFACGGSIISIIGPSKIKDITNEISFALEKNVAINTSLVFKIGLVLAILYVLGALLSYFQSFIMATVTQKISFSLRRDISKKVNKLPLKYLDGVAYGDTLSRITNDVDSVSSNLNNCVASLVSSIVLFVGCLVMMFVINWVLAFCAIASTLLGFLFMRIIVTRSQKYFKRQQDELGNLNGFIEETYTGHTVVKVSNAKDACMKEFQDSNEKLYACSWKAQFFSGLMGPLMQFMGNLSFVVVCIVGSVFCARGELDIGTIVAFIIYVRLFSSPLSTIGQSATSLQTIAAASERVFEILNETEMEDESHKTKWLDPKDIKGDVEFRNVCFGYLKDVPVIKNFSATIKRGQKIAIVGPTGAGKTTIVNLLMRFYEINSGDIFIDGINIKELSRENVHELFSMVLQDTWIFDSTIRGNIVYDKPNVTDEQVVEVCKEAELYHLVKSLPKGIHTQLGENSTMSVGQRQLLTIARAMIQNAPMLILDEATSSVDTRTEVQIQKAMDKLMKGRTSFVIAHRLSTIKNADKILVLKDGNIIEQGTHKELMKKQGFYAELYEASFSKDAE